MVPGPIGRVLRAGPPIMCVILYILHNVYIINTSYFNKAFNLLIYVFIFINIYVIPFIYSYTYSFKAFSPPSASGVPVWYLTFIPLGRCRGMIHYDYIRERLL